MGQFRLVAGDQVAEVVPIRKLGVDPQCEDDNLALLPPPDEEAVGDLRNRAFESMMASVNDGSFEQKLDSARASSKMAEATPKAAVVDMKAQVRSRLEKGVDDGMCEVLAQAQPMERLLPAPAATQEDDDRNLRSAALEALMKGTADGTLEKTINEITATTGTSVVPPKSIGPPALEVLQTGETGSAPPKSPRHQELLSRQQELLDQKRIMEQRLAELQATKAAPLVPVAPLSPAPPSRPRPAAKRPGPSGIAFKEIRQVHQSLSSENARLHNELSRLVAMQARKRQSP